MVVASRITSIDAGATDRVPTGLPSLRRASSQVAIDEGPVDGGWPFHVKVEHGEVVVDTKRSAQVAQAVARVLEPADRAAKCDDDH